MERRALQVVNVQHCKGTSMLLHVWVKNERLCQLIDKSSAYRVPVFLALCCRLSSLTGRGGGSVEEDDRQVDEYRREPLTVVRAGMSKAGKVGLPVEPWFFPMNWPREWLNLANMCRLSGVFQGEKVNKTQLLTLKSSNQFEAQKLRRNRNLRAVSKFPVGQ